MSTNSDTDDDSTDVDAILARMGEDHRNTLPEGQREKLAERRETLTEHVRRKVTLAQAEKHDLDGAPAVAELREHVREEAAALGFDPQTTAEKLTGEYDLSEDVVARLSDPDREELLSHLQAVDEVENSARSGDMADRVLLERREQIEALADENGVNAAALMAHESQTEHASLAGTAPSGEVNTTGVSDRVAKARLEDKIDDVSAAIYDADTQFTEAKLREEKETLEKQLAYHEGE